MFCKQINSNNFRAGKNWFNNVLSKLATSWSDCWKSYNGLVDFGYKKHYRVKHGEGQYAKKELEIIEKKEVEIKNHINGIDYEVASMLRTFVACVK